MDGHFTPAVERSTEVMTSQSKARVWRSKGHGRGGWTGRGGRGGCRVTMERYPLGRGPPGRGRGRDEALNGFGSGRRGLKRMRPYSNVQDRWVGCAGAPPLFPRPPPLMHMRGPSPPMYRHWAPPPPPGYPVCRGPPPLLRARGIPPGPPPCFHPRSFQNGPTAPPPHSPIGRGQRWPGPPGGWHF